MKNIDYKKFYTSKYFESRQKKKYFISGKRKISERNKDIILLLNPLKEDIILEVGCAEGGALGLLSNYSDNLIGIDFSQEAINIAKKRYNTKKIKFIKADAARLDFLKDETIDKIGAFDFIEHIDDKTFDLFLKEAYRILKKGGTISIYTPQRLHWVEIIKDIFKIDPTHIGVRTPKKIIRLIKKHKFDVDLLYFSPNPYPLFRYLDLFVMNIPLIKHLFRFRICLRLKK